MAPKIPGLRGVSLRQVGKYVMNRIRGVRYGGVLTENGIQLRRTSTLRRFTDRMNAQGYLFESKARITPQQAQEYTRKAGTAVKVNPNTQYSHSQLHGTSLILEESGEKITPVLSLVERLAHPTRTFLKITLYNALKNM